jgi:hypothetical protein
MQGVQRQHHPGHVQPTQQKLDDAALTTFVGDLPLTQHDPAAVTDRGDQQHPAGGGDSAA